MSGTTIHISGNSNASNLVLSSESASIHSAENVPVVPDTTVSVVPDTSIVPDTTPLNGKKVYHASTKTWIEDDKTRQLSLLDYTLTDYMLWNTSTPENIVYRPALVETAEIGDYVNYSLLQMDNNLPESRKEEHLTRIKSQWNSIVESAKADVSFGFKYHVEKVVLVSSDNDSKKCDIYLAIISKQKLSDALIADISNLGVSGEEVDFVFSIRNSNSSIVYALANGPYGGAVTAVNDVSTSFMPYTYILKKSDAIKFKLYETVCTHGGLLLMSHNFVNAPAIQNRDGPRPKTNNVDFVGTYHEYIKDGQEYCCYSCLCLYTTTDIVADLTAHVICSSPTSVLEVEKLGVLSDSLRSNIYSYTYLFSVWFGPQSLVAPKISAINIFNGVTIYPDLNSYTLIDNSGLYVTEKLKTAWKTYSLKNPTPSVLWYVKSIKASGMFGPNGLVDWFFQDLKVGDLVPYQVLCFLQSVGSNLNISLTESLSLVSGINTTREKLISNGFATDEPTYGLHTHSFSATEKVANWLIASRTNPESYYALQESQPGCKMLNPGIAISKSTGNINLPYLINHDLGIWEPRWSGIKNFLNIKYPVYGFVPKQGTTTRSTTMTDIIKTFDPSFVFGTNDHLANMSNVASAVDAMIDAFNSNLNTTVAPLKLEFPTFNNRTFADLIVSMYLFGTASPSNGGLFLVDNYNINEGEGTPRIHSYSNNIINSIGINSIGNYNMHQLIQTKDFSSVALAEAAANAIKANPPTSVHSWVVAIDEKQFDAMGTLIPNKVTLILVQCATTAPALNSISTTGLRGVIQDPNDYVLPLN